MSVFKEQIKLTKQELRKQKNLLKTFRRYLPTLVLKMQQLKISLNHIEQTLNEKIRGREEYAQSAQHWHAVFGEDYSIDHLVSISSVSLTQENLAGIIIPKLVCVNFHPENLRLFTDPLWVDAGVTYIKQLIQFDAEIKILRIQLHLVGEELKITTQRVNLFEKIRIPNAAEAIKKITIYLGDQYTATVVRGKIAKQRLGAM